MSNSAFGYVGFELQFFPDCSRLDLNFEILEIKSLRILAQPSSGFTGTHSRTRRGLLNSGCRGVRLCRGLCPKDGNPVEWRARVVLRCGPRGLFFPAVNLVGEAGTK